MAITKRIRQYFKKIFDSIRNEKLKIGFLQAVPFWIASIITGLLAVLYARLFAYSEKMAAEIYHGRLWLLFICSPIFFLIAWWVVKKWAPYSRGSGIPQVIAAIDIATPKHQAKISKLLSLRIIIVKAISSCMMILGGAVVGREGPTIQIAGSVFRKINMLLPEWWPKISKKNMIMTGAASGLAAAFNTPLGGIVFAVEELTKTHISYFKTAVFTGVIVAGLTADALAGPYLYLGYPNMNHLSHFIFIAVIPVAIVAGLGSSFMCKMMLVALRWKKSFKADWKTPAYVAGAAFILAAMAVFINENVLGSGKDLMTQTLFTANKHLPWYLPILKATGSFLSFTSGGAGGVFAPALSAGAGIGSVMASWFNETDANTNLLILAGMVAFLTGVTRTPFTSAILVLEMTDRHDIIFHLMLSGMIASFVSIIVDKHSLYEHLKHEYVHDILKEEHEQPEEQLTDQIAHA
ncbi:MAG: chloride channel protein [Bacteroidota bacterium]|nr:chloride channel protein [Bacteroidota bacterium]